MGDFKSKLPDFKEIGSMATKLFKDVKSSVGEIITDYKEKRAEEAEKASQEKQAEPAAEKPAEKKPDESKQEAAKAAPEETKEESAEEPKNEEKPAE
jgi:Sec-independent protein translocase protein TatA